MITWMQKHKKWLVITIWISTIAFVGAGFVGWGSYDYGSKGGVVAVVGDKEVTVEEYNQEYSALYSQYSQIFGNSFSKEVAEQLRLKDIAFSQLLQKNLIMAYGQSLGLVVTQEEVAKELMNYNEFKTNGAFDKDKYINILNQNRISPKEFESSLESSILFRKVQTLFSIEPTLSEIENLNRLLFLEDDITYKILTLSDAKVDFTNDDVKKFYEDNKSMYTSEISFDLQIKELSLKPSNSTLEELQSHYEKFKTDYKFEDGKLKSFEEAKEQVQKDLDENFTKKEALTLYLKLKKDEEKFDRNSNFKDSKLPFDSENIAKIKEAKAGEILKPFFEKDRYYIVKVDKINPSSILSFEDAKSKVEDDLIRDLKLKKLEDMAKSELENFKGVDVKGVNRSSASKFDGLTQQEAVEFLNQLFSSSQKESFVKVGSKIVIYRVNSSKMANYDKTKDVFIQNEIRQIQESDLVNNLLKKLENKFTIKTSIETKE